MRAEQTIATILEQALARAKNPSRIVHVQILKGDLIEDDDSSIRSRWAMLAKNTPAENPELQIQTVRAQVQCMICRQIYEPADRQIICPFCGSVGAKIISGEQFSLGRVELS